MAVFPNDDTTTTYRYEPFGAARILRRDDLGNALAGACFAVSNAAGFQRNVCDGGDGDGDPVAGTVLLPDLAPNDYDVAETTPPAGYALAAGVQTITVPSGGAGEITFASGPATDPCAGPQDMIAPGVEWVVYEGDLAFDGAELLLLDPALTIAQTFDACVDWEADAPPPSLRLTARVRLHTSDMLCLLRIRDDDNGNYFEVWFSGDALDDTYAPNGFIDVYGPYGESEERLDGFRAGEDVLVTLEWTAATLELTVRFEQGARVETVTVVDGPPFAFVPGAVYLEVLGEQWADAPLPPGTPALSVYDLTYEQF